LEFPSCIQKTRALLEDMLGGAAEFMLCNALTLSSKFGRNVVGAGCPDAGLGIDVVMGNIQIDGQFQLG